VPEASFFTAALQRVKNLLRGRLNTDAQEAAFEARLAEGGPEEIMRAVRSGEFYSGTQVVLETVALGGTSSLARGATTGIAVEQGATHLDDLLRPGGQFIGSVIKGTTPNIRTVSSQEFSTLHAQLMNRGAKQVPKSSYKGTWYELPGGGSFGVRQARSGLTLDFDLPGFPKGFKVHQK